MAYVFTASKASSVRLACRANFLADQTTSLITVSSNTIYIHQEHSLDISHEITCYGRISSITAFKYYESKLDQLFVTTDDNKYFTLSYIDGHVITSTTGSINSTGLSTPEIGHRVLANSTYLVLYLFNGIVSVIPIHQGANPKKRAADGNRLIGSPQQLRLDEIKIHGIALIDNSAESNTFGVLYRDMNLETHLKTYDLHQRKGDIELRKGGLSLNHLEHGTNIIAPLKNGAVCCIGESTLYTKSANGNQMEYPIATPTLFNSSTMFSSQEWVLGDDYGLLYSLSFAQTEPVLKQLPLPKKLESQTSHISIPATLVAMKDQLFLGSHYSYSQLLSYPSLEIAASKNNMGPISDILVEPSKGAGGSSSLIAATGAYKDGALRVIKYGVGMIEQAELEVQNIRGIWGVSDLSIVVVGFVDSYIVLRVSEDGQIDQLEQGDEELIYACSVAQNLVLVTNQGIVISNDGVQLQSQTLHSITAAKLSDSTLFLVNDTTLECWRLENDSFALKHSKTFEQEVSTFEAAYGTVIVSFWGDSALWIGDFDLNQVTSEDLKSSSTPHCIILQELSKMEHSSLLIAMNDGSLISYSLDKTRTLSNKKESVLGTTPIVLHVFQTRQGPNVFAVCDRPTIIHSSRGKLAFSNFSIPSCTYFTAFDSTALNSCMIVATENGLSIGGIDDIQKLQYDTIPLNESCRRLAKTATAIGALTMRMEVELVTGNETQKSFLKVYDPTTFEMLDQYELQENEMCQALCSIIVDDKECFAVGTAIADDEQDECVRGRIMIFGLQESDRSLWMRSQVEVPGSAYCLAAVGTYLAAGVNSFVRLFSLSADSFKEIHKYRSSTYSITMAAYEDTLLVGDLMKSVTYLKVAEGELQEIARDYVPTWMTSVQFCDEKTFIGAEAEGNLILLAESDSSLPENQRRLDRIGQFRYGEMINRLVPGTFIVPEDTTIVQPHTLFGTVDGSIGCIGTIQTEYVNLLLSLQSNIGKCRPTIGNLSHAEFRGYRCAGMQNDEPERFVDGDLIEEYLELNDAQKEVVCQGLNKSPAEIEKIVENLARLR